MLELSPITPEANTVPDAGAVAEILPLASIVMFSPANVGNNAITFVVTLALV